MRRPSSVARALFLGWIACVGALVGAAACAPFASEPATQVDAEAGAPSEGGQETGPLTDGGCASDSHALCDDFEGALGAKWSGGTSILAPGDLAQSAEQHFSPTHALLVSMGDGGATGDAQLIHTFATPNTAGMTCDFELFIETLSRHSPPLFTGIVNFSMAYRAESEALGLSASFGAGPGSSNISIMETMSDGGVWTTYPTAGALPFRSWRHIRFDVDLIARTLSVTLNGATTIFSQQFPVSFAKNNGLNLNLGLLNDPGTKYFVDDFVCDVR